MEMKLLDCPFCGGEAEFQFADWALTYYSVALNLIHCKKCGCRYQHPSGEKVESQEGWNTRIEKEAQLNSIRLDDGERKFIEKEAYHRGFKEGQNQFLEQSIKNDQLKTNVMIIEKLKPQPTGIEPLDEEKILEVIRKWNYGFSTTDTEEALYQLKKAICSRFGTPKERLVEWPEKVPHNLGCPHESDLRCQCSANEINKMRKYCIEAYKKAGFGTRPEGK